MNVKLKYNRIPPSFLSLLTSLNSKIICAIHASYLSHKVWNSWISTDATSLKLGEFENVALKRAKRGRVWEEDVSWRINSPVLHYQQHYLFRMVGHLYFSIVIISVKRLATGCTVRESNPGGDEIFHTCPDRPWGRPSLLYNGYRVFPRGQVWPGRAADHSPPSSAEVLEE